MSQKQFIIGNFLKYIMCCALYVLKIEACIGCFGIRDIVLFLRDTGIKRGGGGIILGYGMFEFLWGHMTFLKIKKIINKHKITAELLNLFYGFKFSLGNKPPRFEGKAHNAL